MNEASQQDVMIHPSSLFGNLELIASSGRRWWAIYTRRQQEAETARRLLEMNIAFFAPLITQHFDRGRHRVTSYALFPNYVFIFATEEEKIKALSMETVSRVIEIVDQEQLSRDLVQIHRLLIIGAPIQRESRIIRGDRVRIRSGTFAGFEGVVTTRQGETRLLVHLKFLQAGASVLLDERQLERLDSVAGETGTVEPLEWLMDPGQATKEELSELFFELSKLYRMMGGSGVKFTVTECRESANAEVLP